MGRAISIEMNQALLATLFAMVLLIAPAWTVAQSIQDDAVITVTNPSCDLYCETRNSIG
jgi:hypothetical protein